MYITVRTIISNGGEIDTAVKYYYDYETAKTNLIMQRDILTLELLIKYTKGDASFEDFATGISSYGSLTFKDDILEFVDNTGDYHIKYEIKRPENLKNDYFYNLASSYNNGLKLL